MRSSNIGSSYQIGELATLSDLTPDTLRYYERLGLVSPVARTEGGFRVYGPATRARLRFIKHAQRLGLALHEIRDLVAYQDHGGLDRCRHVRDLLRAKLAELEAKLRELEEFRGTLSSYLLVCEQTLSRKRPTARGLEPKCPVIETLKTERQ